MSKLIRVRNEILVKNSCNFFIVYVASKKKKLEEQLKVSQNYIYKRFGTRSTYKQGPA